MAEGVKAIKDVIGALKPVAVFVKKVAADGKVNLEDLPAVVELAKELDTILAAAKEVNEIPAEIKDIDEQEALEIIGAVFALIKAVKAA